jgi:hypothetical protein
MYQIPKKIEVAKIYLGLLEDRCPLRPTVNETAMLSKVGWGPLPTKDIITKSLRHLVVVKLGQKHISMTTPEETALSGIIGSIVADLARAGVICCFLMSMSSNLKAIYVSIKVISCSLTCVALPATRQGRHLLGLRRDKSIGVRVG